jgi:hypothetical protein
MIGAGDFGYEQRAAFNARVASRDGGRRARRGSPPPRAFLSTTGCFLDSDDIRPDSVLMQVVAADIAWRFSVEDWQARRPPSWALRRLRRWRDEFALLAEEQDRIANTARFFGVSD